MKRLNVYTRVHPLGNAEDLGAICCLHLQGQETVAVDPSTQATTHQKVPFLPGAHPVTPS